MVLKMFAPFVFGISLLPENNSNTNMKKILFLIAATALLCVAVSCNDDDEPKHGNGVFTENQLMVNHIVNTANGQVVGIAGTTNKLTFDTKNLKGSIELYYNDGSDALKLNDLTAIESRYHFYKLSSPSHSEFSGYIDLNEYSRHYTFTTKDGNRIISTTPEVFFMKTENTVVYSDETPTSTKDNVNYTFSIDPASKTTTITVSHVVHVKDVKYFESITANNVPITVTTNGYAIQAQNLKTTAIYYSSLDSLGHNHKTTDKYPFKTFNATIDLMNDHLDANYMIGNDATVTASGCTYPDYTSY